MPGSIADHDRLGEALATYNQPAATPLERLERLAALKATARLCGWGDAPTQSVVYWATRRLATYRRAIQSDAAERLEAAAGRA